MVVFENNGILDFDALSSFGVNVKDNDSAIGYFGTGLKYAMAIAVREGLDMTIYLGNDAHKIGSVTKTIRGKEFTFITCGEKQLGFTTELGKNWKLWMAYRELYCNAMDEGGRVTKDTPAPAPDKTVIAVEGMDHIHADRGKYLLQSKPLISSDGIELHNGSSGAIFYRGIRAYELRDRSIYTYNITERMPLTEDRTIAAGFIIPQKLTFFFGTEVHNTTVLESVLHAGEGTHERKLDFMDLRGCKPSNTFMEYMEKHHRDLSGVNRTASEFYRRVANVNLATEPSDPMTEREQQMLTKACGILNKMGYSVTEEKVKFFASLGKGISGSANSDFLCITRDAMDRGMRYLVSTLLEEHIHHAYGYLDESRELQTWLFDELVSAQCNAHNILI